MSKSYSNYIALTGLVLLSIAGWFACGFILIILFRHKLGFHNQHEVQSNLPSEIINADAYIDIELNNIGLELYRIVEETHDNNNDNTQLSCNICIDSLSGDFVVLVCGHSFHNSCIDTWFETTQTCIFVILCTSFTIITI